MNTQKMIRVLLTAIDSGSFTKAGEILGYTQSNLTQMMRSFEEEVGFPLLIKSKKGVSPTREALRLVPIMREMQIQEEKLFQEIADINGIKKGTIRIGSFVSTSAAWLPQLLTFFQETYPDIVFEVIESGQDEMERGVYDGSLDLALMSSPDQSNIDFIPILDDPLFVVFSKKHDLSQYDFVPVEFLSKYPFIMTYDSYDRDVRRVFDHHDIEPDVKYFFRDDSAVLSMVQHGLGIAILPELTTERFPGDYDCRMLEPEAYRTLGVGVRSIKEAGPLARLVIDHIIYQNPNGLSVLPSSNRLL